MRSRGAAATIDRVPLDDDVPRLLDQLIGCDGSARLTAAARDYLAEQPWPGRRTQIRQFAARLAACGDVVLDVPHCAVLLYGERRVCDRWRATAPHALPMPNRRRPQATTAAEGVIDVVAVRNHLDAEAAAVRPRGTLATWAAELGVRRAAPRRRTLPTTGGLGATRSSSGGTSPYSTG